MVSKRKKPAAKRRDSLELREQHWVLLGELRAQQRFIHQLIVSMPEYVFGPRRMAEPHGSVLERLAKLEERVTALEPR